VMTAEELLREASDIGLSHVARELAGMAGLSYRITPKPSDGSARNGSHLGGSPDLPASVSWPVVDSRALTFIGQIQLDELGGLDRRWTDAGLLSFFCDRNRETGEVWNARVLTNPCGVGVVPSAPVAESARATALPHLPASFRAELTLPPFESTYVEPLALDDTDMEKYFQLQDRLVVAQAGSKSGDDELELAARHRFLGHPDQIQGDLQDEAAAAAEVLQDDSTAPNDSLQASTWKLLLQVDSDDALDVMWGDGGTIYFMIRHEDLQRLNFDRVVVTFQCN
jgi:Domain of unknown function (DUF1963)